MGKSAGQVRQPHAGKRVEDDASSKFKSRELPGNGNDADRRDAEWSLIVATANPEDAAILRSPDFGKKFEEWRSNPASASVAFVIMLTMERPEAVFHDSAERRFVAYDASFYPDTAVEDRAENQRFWEAMIDVQPPSMDFVKSGPVIWKTLGIVVPERQTQDLMRMSSIDGVTSEAVQAALWSGFNTANELDPIDMGTAAFVLASFIHAHPAFRNFLGNDVFTKPYGEATVYGRVKKSRLDAVSKEKQGNGVVDDHEVVDPDMPDDAA